MAGFSSVQVIERPKAALRAFGLPMSEVVAHFVVIHFGGSTLALSLVRAERGKMEVEKTFYGFLGGRNVDARIVTKLSRVVMRALRTTEIPAARKNDIEDDLN